jgi:hypothetical protein
LANGRNRPILLNNSTLSSVVFAASVERKEDRWLGALYFVLAMLFGADSDRHFCHFWFCRAQPLRHSS